MPNTDEMTSASAALQPVIPLPYALYVSGNLTFELYDGGRPRQYWVIQWEHLKPVKLTNPSAPTESK